MSVNNSNNSRKRSLPTQENESEPAAKRQKLDLSTKSTPKSSIFPNDLDQFQYQQIYQVLHDDMIFEDIIAKNIAEFATGRIVKCENYKNCKNNIFTLHEHDSMHQFHGNSFLDYYRYIDDDQKGEKKTKIFVDKQRELFFCNPCCRKIRKCGYVYDDLEDNGYSFRCCRVPFVEQFKKCQCGKDIKNRCYKHISLCSYCKCSKCDDNECSFHGICVVCKSKYCGKKKREKYKCEYCKKYLCLECVELLECGHYHHINKCKISMKVLSECSDCGKVKCWKNMIKCIKCNGSVCKKCIKFDESKLGYNKQQWTHLNCNLAPYECVQSNNLKELCL